MKAAPMHYFKVRTASAGLHFSLAPGELIAYPGRDLPATLTALERGGTLERLAGPPGLGFDVRVLADREFAPEPAERVEEKASFSVESVCERFAWTVAQYREARGRYGFPDPDATRELPVAGRDVPHTAHYWRPSTLDRWEQGIRALLANPRTGWGH